MPQSLNNRDWQVWRQLIWQRRFYVVVSVVLALSLGLVLALKTDPVYRASSTVMIIDADLLSGSQLRFVPGAPQHNEIDYFRRRIMSEQFLLNVLDSLDLQRDPKLKAKIAQLFYENPQIDRQVIAKQIYVEHLSGLISTRMRAYNLIEIGAEGPTSEFAYHLASLVTDLAIADSKQSQMQTVSDASSFTLQQLDIYRKRLNDAENRLNVFNQSILEQGLGESQLSQEKLSEIQSIKLSAEVDFQAKQDQMNKLLSTSMLNISFSYRSQLDSDISELKRRLLNRTDDVCELLKKFSWRDVEIVLLNEDIGQLRKTIYEAIKTNLDAHFKGESKALIDAATSLEVTRIDLILLQRTREVLGNIIQAHSEYVRRQPALQGTKAKMERDVLVSREIYEMLLHSAQGSQIRESAQVKETQMKFKLISPPQRPLERIKPQRTRIMMMAMVLGLAMGFGLIMLREVLDVTVKTVEDVTNYLQVPVLSTIPKIETPRQKARRKYLRLAVVVAIPLLAFFSMIIVIRILGY